MTLTHLALFKFFSGMGAPLVVVTYTPSEAPPGRPALRNQLFWKLPDLGTLALRTDRLTGGSKEARLRAAAGMAADYTMVMPGTLPDASRPVVVAADGSMSYGSRELRGQVTWDPPSIGSGAKATTTVTVTGAAVGDPAYVGFTTVVPAGLLLSAAVTATSTVTVTLFNIDAGATDLASGTLNVVVLKS